MAREEEEEAHLISFQNVNSPNQYYQYDHSNSQHQYNEKEEAEEFTCCCKCKCCCVCWTSCWDAILSYEQIAPQRNFCNFWKDSMRHLWRGLSTNLSIGISSDSEQNFLASKGVTGKFAQNYLTWRRSCLYTIIIPILVHLYLSIANLRDIQILVTQLTLQYPEMIGSFGAARNLFFAANIITTVVQAVALILAIVSLTKWYDYKRSRRLALWSWILYFFSPFLVTFVPYRLVVDIPMEPPANTIFEMRSALGLVFGLYYFLNLAPGTFTLSLALFRAALNMRSLIPQNALLGYLCVLIPIVTTPLVWLAFVPLIQTIGDGYMLFSFVVFSFSPLTFLIFSKYMTTPMTFKEAHKYATRIRMGYLTFLVVSVLGFMSFIVMGRLKEVFADYLTFSTFLELCFAFLSEYFFGYVFASDLFVTIVLGTSKQKNDVIVTDELERENNERTNQLFQIINN